MKPLKLLTHNPEETVGLGKAIGRLAMPGDIYLLSGQLGTGKTCLTQGIAQGLEISDYVPSPSFVIMREIHGRLPLYHMDFYRLDRLVEIADLGLDDYLYGRGVCVIEWAEKGIEVLPEDHLSVKILYMSEMERSFEINPYGVRYETLVADLRKTVISAVKGN
jgi:tRNA threonylcarbamoyladenosine biosynthesis protein TsaE